jgi:hemolysin III
MQKTKKSQPQKENFILGQPKLSSLSLKHSVQKLEQYLLEPINTLTHLFGAAASFAGLLLLASLTKDEPGKMLSLVIYGSSMTLLFIASALLHGAKLPQKHRMWLNRLDHSAIFLMLAGTYTPIIYNLFPESWRWPTLIGYWSVALAGIIYKLFGSQIHSAINKTIYPILSWGGIIPAVFASLERPLFTIEGFSLILLGGLIYMVGFLIYYRQRPNPIPGMFGYHEIWHLFVLAGSACHYLFMLRLIVPA